jgi:glycosyltransferase involved in cell wall biosynthesis
MKEKDTRKFTLRDIFRHNNIWHQRSNFEKRGSYEVEAIKQVENVIGRTDWDKACVQRLNPDVKYHFCNETLRPAFYEHKWDISNCERHSIFVSQSLYPIKGFHLMLEAMCDIVKEYPDAHLYTTGADPRTMSFKNKLRRTYYSKHLEKLIKKYNLTDHVTFLGRLGEEEMCDRYLRSHVFVSPSSIENSPNSVGEAMILGVPTVSSDVGGVKNQLTHNEEGFVYQADAPYMAAYYVKKIFADDGLAKSISEAAKRHAEITYNKDLNFSQLEKIYMEISGK